MKWILSILFVIMLYIVYPVLLTCDNYSLILISGLLLFVIGILNISFSIKYAIKSKEPKERIEMRRVMLFLKILSVPFFVVNFLIWTGTSILSIYHLGFIVWFYMPMIIIITFLILLVTSSYSISTILIYGKSKYLKNIEIIIHILLQLFFVFDVIDVIYLFVILRKRELTTN